MDLDRGNSGGGGKLGREEGWETVVRMYCMKEEYSKRKKWYSTLSSLFSGYSKGQGEIYVVVSDGMQALSKSQSKPELSAFYY